ncbi:Formyltransferase [Atractiella rhizophila]|nr:Formyltransferase [Atractiella rhizophila]
MPARYHILRLSPGRTGTRAFSSTKAVGGTGKKWNILFFGSDDFSCSILEKVIQKDLASHIHVVVPSSKRIGRNRQELYIPELLRLSQRLSLPTTTWARPFALPSTFSDTRSPTNLLLSASFGHLIPSSVIDAFPHAQALNVHPSLLPRWRGPAPVFWTLLNGDKHTGVTIQELQKGAFDGGRILGQVHTNVGLEDDYAILLGRLKESAGDLTVDVLKNFDKYKAQIQTQDMNGVSHAPKITRDHARINWDEWDRATLHLYNRALRHKHHLWTYFLPSPPPENKPITANHKPYRLSFVSLSSTPLSPTTKEVLSHQIKSVGEFSAWKEAGRYRLAVRMKDGWLEVDRVQVLREGRPKELSAGEWFTGYVKARAVEGKFISSLKDEHGAELSAALH